MVLYSNNPAEMYTQLQDLQKAAQGRRRMPHLQCHNYVNNADAVPRSLGSSLDALHQAVESYVPIMGVSLSALTLLDHHRHLKLRPSQNQIYISQLVYVTTGLVLGHILSALSCHTDLAMRCICVRRMLQACRCRALQCLASLSDMRCHCT